MSNDSSNKDLKDWAKFINSKEKLPNKDLNFKPTKQYKTRSIDLHGFTLEEANKKIENVINKSFLENVNKLIVVTGKGLNSKSKEDPYVSKDLSLLKYSVPEFILKNKNLMQMITNIHEAKIEDGGSGAFYIFLKKKKYEK